MKFAKTIIKASKSIMRVSFYAGIVLIFLGAITGLCVYYYFSRNLPEIITVEDYRPLIITDVYSEENIKIGEFYREKRKIISYDEIPSVVIKAFVSSEDDSFFDHHGIDLISIFRAAIVNFRAGKIVQGGSTITQQVAKSLLLSPEKKYSRKIREAILANAIEKHLSKEQILYLYLNQIFLGKGAYGVQAGAERYFGKSIRDISLAEAALLAGLPQAPSRYNPIANPEMAKERQKYVLTRMVESRFITPEEATQAFMEPLRIKYKENINIMKAPYFTEHVRRYLIEKYGAKTVYEDGLKVYTTLKYNKLKAAQAAIKNGLHALDKRQGFRGPNTELKTNDEMLAFRNKVHKDIISDIYHFRILTPDSRLIEGYEHIEDTNTNLNLEEIISQLGSESDKQEETTPLVKDKIYEAVVTYSSHRKEFSIAYVGHNKGIIPHESLEWMKKYNSPVRRLKKGDTIYVTLHSEDFDSANSNVDSKHLKNLTDLSHFSLEQKPEVQGALISFNIQSQTLESMVGGHDFLTTKSEFNRAVQAHRQPGSTFKPIIYAAALDKGYTSAKVIVDSPLIFQDDDSEFQKKWKPKNYGERFMGDTTMQRALVFSRNVPTVKILQDIRIPYVANYARRLGIISPLNLDLSLALGSSTTTLEEITKVFAVFGNDGKKISGAFINKILDRTGNTLEEYFPDQKPDIDFRLVEHAAIEGDKYNQLPPEKQENNNLPETLSNLKRDENGLFVFDDPNQIIPPQTAYVLTHMLKNVIQVGTGKNVSSLPRPTAGKTGTSQEFHDAWFIGYTPHIVTGVWIGYDEEKSLGQAESGSRAAAPVWLDYMMTAIKDTPKKDFAVPEGIEFAYINSKNGKLASPSTRFRMRAAFIEGTMPNKYDMAAVKSTSVDPTEEVEDGVDPMDFYQKDLGN